MFREYYSTLLNSETTYVVRAGDGHGGEGSFDPGNNEISANLENTYAFAQEHFHAFHSDLGVYTPDDFSVMETEGDLVSAAITLSIGHLAMAEDWNQGSQFNYTNDNLEFDETVFSEEFNNDFNRAVDARIAFYEKRATQNENRAPNSYVQKKSGVDALAIKELVRRMNAKKD